MKAKLALEFIYKNEIDVMLIQEGGSFDWEKSLRKDYHSTRNKDSLIILKKSAIGPERKDLYQKYKEELNFNNDTQFYFS